MELVRLGERGREKPGVVVGDGRIKDCSAHVADYDHAFFAGGGLEQLGPWLVTPDEVTAPQKLGLTLDVNGTRRQTGTTASMIFDVLHIVHYLSQFLMLEAGDVVEAAIDGLGSQRSVCEPA